MTHPEAAPTLVTSAEVALVLTAAWTDRRCGRPLSAAAKATQAWPEVYLVWGRHEREWQAMTDRERATLSGMAITSWLREVGGSRRSPTSHARYWRRACQLIADGLNGPGPKPDET